ncbi:MAG: biopolymer transport protein ExbD [Paracoccaceae bacterium]|jgi:biopolymer transport protein ExbD
MFAFAPQRPRRKPSLTPMIDVVFLLLVFFMLAARFGQDMSLPLSTAAGGHVAWDGAPRLITVQPETLLLNGAPIPPNALTTTLRPLMPTPDAPVLLRPAATTDLARLVAVIDALRAGGFTRLIVVE